MVTERVDTGADGAEADGIVGANEYGSGNALFYTGGGTGFGGGLGNAVLLVESDAGAIGLAFTGLGIHVNDDQYIVYFNSRSGGFQTNGEMTDTSDPGRANTSRLSTDGSESVTFSNAGQTAKADFAWLFNNRAPENNGFSAVFRLKGAGSLHSLIPHQVAGLGTTNVELNVGRSWLGLTNGASLDMVALQLGSSGYLSNEGIPEPGLGPSNPGFNTGGNHLIGDFHRFVPVSYDGLVRVPNTSLRMPPLPPASGSTTYVLSNAFGSLIFDNTPIAIASAPGETNRLYIAERRGVIQVITNLANPDKTQFLNISNRVSIAGEGGLLGLAFHPDYATNRYFFVFYTATGAGFSNRVARFRTLEGNPNAADPASETILFGQYDEEDNHNGGDIHFGPDGYLYVGLGDEGGFNDNKNNAQIITNDFFSGILRIDVDKRPGNPAPNPHPAIGLATNYAVPADNPFLGATSFYGVPVNPSKVRTEFFAVGLRNPFRFTFDPVGGDLLCGDVGQDAWEEVDRITNGGNYGWAYREGFVGGPKFTANPPSLYANPLLAYAHGTGTNQGFSITGGVVYRGNRLPELYGHYIFGDYGSANIWAMTHNGQTNTSWRRLLGGNTPVGFGVDPNNGDVLICDFTTGIVSRLVAGSPPPGDFPDTLEETGAFVDAATLTPHDGIVPFEINVPFWSDGAIKSRWFSIPSTNAAADFHPVEPWGFPTGTVWIKHFDIELTNGVPESRKRLETRFLVKNDSLNGGYGVTYRWGSSASEAFLVPEEGLDEEIVINEGGVIRTQTWHYPGRGECLVCHQSSAGFGLGFNTVQLNKDSTHAGLTTNQLVALSHAGYIDTAIESTRSFRALAAATNAAYSSEYRARSYLQANCSQCHTPGGLAPANFDTRISTPVSGAGLIEGLLSNDMGNSSNRVIRRGDTAHSMVLTRISSLGGGRMPPLASSVLDTQGIALVAAWIGDLQDYETFAEWQVRHFGATNLPDALTSADPDLDGAPNDTEYLTGTDPTNATPDGYTAGILASENGRVITYTRPANRGTDVQKSTNLLENVWRSMDVPGNAHFVPAQTDSQMVEDTDIQDGEGFYRVRIFEP